MRLNARQWLKNRWHYSDFAPEPCSWSIQRSAVVVIARVASYIGPSRRSTMAPQNGLSPEVSSDRTMQSRCGVGQSSEREDDQDDVSSPDQVNDRMPGRLGNVGRCVLEPPE